MISYLGLPTLNSLNGHIAFWCVYFTSHKQQTSAYFQYATFGSETFDAEYIKSQQANLIHSHENMLVTKSNMNDIRMYVVMSGQLINRKDWVW